MPHHPIRRVAQMVLVVLALLGCDQSAHIAAPPGVSAAEVEQALRYYGWQQDARAWFLENVAVLCGTRGNGYYASDQHIELDCAVTSATLRDVIEHEAQHAWFYHTLGHHPGPDAREDAVRILSDPTASEFARQQVRVALTEDDAHIPLSVRRYLGYGETPRWYALAWFTYADPARFRAEVHRTYLPTTHP